MTDNDIVSRLNRILSAADERGLDETECRAMQDAVTEIEKMRNNPFTWWVREKNFNCTIEANVAVTFEFLQEADALGNDEILRHVCDMIAGDIMAAYRKRNNELFGTPNRISNKENNND
jgi:hypothetical protein